jgi:hypothetical protein
MVVVPRPPLSAASAVGEDERKGCEGVLDVRSVVGGEDGVEDVPEGCDIEDIIGAPLGADGEIDVCRVVVGSTVCRVVGAGGAWSVDGGVETKAGGNVPPTRGGPTITLIVGACVVDTLSGSRSSSAISVGCDGCVIAVDVGGVPRESATGKRMAGSRGAPALVTTGGADGANIG